MGKRKGRKLTRNQKRRAGLLSRKPGKKRKVMLNGGTPAICRDDNFVQVQPPQTLSVKVHDTVKVDEQAS